MAITIGDSSITGLAAGGLGSNVITGANMASGMVVGSKFVIDSTTRQYLANGSGARVSIIDTTYTPKYSSTSTKIIIEWLVSHGVGPAGTDLNAWGGFYGVEWNGSLYQRFYQDVPLSANAEYSYGPEWLTTSDCGHLDITSYSAGTSYSVRLQGWLESGNYQSINRPYTYNGSRGYTSLLILEVKL